MKMTIPKLRRVLEERLKHDERNITYDRENESLRIENKAINKGITVSLPPLLAKWEQKKELIIDETVYYIEEALSAMSKSNTSSNKNNIYPVIRSTSFPTKTETGGEMLYDTHTAETRIYYAVDLGNSYRLVDEKMLEKEQWDPKEIREIAKFNVRSLPCPLKMDTVAGNDFYFLNSNDGYDASRILNEPFLREMEGKMKGKMVISIPHQDVLIFADIQNQAGYDILAQMSMSFFTNGLVPITSLSFYYENGKLEPIFILAKNKPTGKE